jgi:hypothetical protein
MRLIDADAFLNRVLPECKYPELLKKAVDEQPTIEPEVRHGRWISVEDALPELDTMVIVCYYGSDCIFPMQGETVTEAVARQNKVPTVTMGFLSEEGWNGVDMFPMMIRPTFWMNLPDAPLPEPPEKE